MKKEIGRLHGRGIYIESDVEERTLIAKAILEQIDTEKVTVGEQIAVPIVRKLGSMVTIVVEVKEIITI